MDARQAESQDPDDSDDDNTPSDNSPTPGETQAAPLDSKRTSNLGKFLLDATCTPADIAYPTVSLTFTTDLSPYIYLSSDGRTLDPIHIRAVRTCDLPKPLAQLL